MNLFPTIVPLVVPVIGIISHVEGSSDEIICLYILAFLGQSVIYNPTTCALSHLLTHRDLFVLFYREMYLYETN
jgi:hypothetical protein